MRVWSSPSTPTFFDDPTTSPLSCPIAGRTQTLLHQAAKVSVSIWGFPPRDTYHSIITSRFFIFSTLNDFDESIDSVSTALSIIHIALELLFEECVKACVRFIEAVAWTREEELQVLDVIHLLKEEESRELRARVCVEKEECTDKMFLYMIGAALGGSRDSKKWKSCERQRLLVESFMRDFAQKGSIKFVFSKVFGNRLSLLQTLFKQYFESLHDKASVSLHILGVLKQLMWLVERVIELRVANDVVSKWSDDETSLDANLLKFLRDDRGCGI